MFLTPTEAKDKWCPSVRIGSQRGTTNMDQFADEHMHTKCIGTGCMGWRWKDGTKTTGYCGVGGVPKS